MTGDIPKLNETDDLGGVIRQLNVLINDYNFFQNHISLKSNLDGQILENLTFAAGEIKTIPHKLGKVPAGRIIIRQEGNGVLSDIPSDWNSKSIKMINNGAVSVTATILIVRE